MLKSSSLGPASVSSEKASKRVLNVAIEDFRLGMEKFVAMFCDNYGVRLVFQGTGARTDGKTIYVPELAILARPNMTDAQVNEALDFLMTTRGFIYHEGAHVIFSDMSVVTRAKRKGEKFRFLVNALEDSRIENKISQVYPGAKEALIFTNQWVTDRIAEKIKTGETQPSKYTALLYAMMLVGNIVPNHERMQLWSVLSQEAKDLALELQSEVLAARRAPDSEAVLKVARRIWKRIAELEEENRPPSPLPPPSSMPEEEEKDPEDDGESTPQEDSDKDEHDGDDVGDGSASEDVPKEPEHEEPSEEATEATEQQEPEEPEEEALPSILDDEDEDEDTGCKTKGAVIRDEAQKYARELRESGDQSYRIYSTENDFIGPPPDPATPEAMQSCRAYVAELDESVRFAYGPVKRTLENTLKARSHVYHVCGLDDGDLDQSNLYKLAIANTDTRMKEQARRVFSQTVQASSLKDTVCSLSIDISGSMNAHKSYILAQKAALVFAHALEAVTIPFEVTAWSTKAHGTAERVMKPLSYEEQSLYTRFGGLYILEVKRFTEPWAIAKNRLIHVTPQEANYDGEAVRFSAQRLMLRPEKRKVLFVLCDGVPGPDKGEDCEAHAKYLHTVVKEIRTSTSVELIGVGINALHAGEFYRPHFVNVSDVSELPSIVLSQLTRLLLKTR